MCIFCDIKKKYVQVSRIEALFRITMGKEVELYGQIMEKEYYGGEIESVAD